MKKEVGKIIGVLTLALSLVVGIPVHAEGNNSGLTLDVSAPTGMSGTNVEVGDTLEFKITLSGMAARTDLGGAFLRFRVATKEDGLDSTRIGNPVITSTSKCFPEAGNAGNGLASISTSLNSDGTMDDSGEAVVTLPITNDMTGKTLYYKADFKMGTDPAFIETDVRTINVEGDSSPEVDTPEVAISADVKADMNKLEKGKTFPIELTVTNPGKVNLTHVFVTAGYSETGIQSGMGPDPEPLGTFVELPAGVTQPENGEAYIPTLAVGASVKLKLNAVIPVNYGKDNIVFSYAAGAFKDGQQQELLAVKVVEENGTIVKAVPEVLPEPEKPTPPDSDTSKSGGNALGVAKAVQPKPADKTTVPRTGDTAPVAGAIAVVLGALGVMGVAVKKRAAK